MGFKNFANIVTFIVEFVSICFFLMSFNFLCLMKNLVLGLNLPYTKLYKLNVTFLIKTK